MLLSKTALAHSTLQAGSNAGLSLSERRILIVIDGKRSLDEVVALLGPDILPAIDHLRKNGYLQQAGNVPVSTHAAPAGNGVSGALTSLLRATTDAVQARTEQIRSGNARQPVPIPAQTHTAPAASASPRELPAPPSSTRGQRRSLVAAKMYMIDMLQLQRHPDAVEHKARIQFASDDGDLLDAILSSLRTLHQLTSASYGQRIVTRLGESLPEALLPALAQTVATLQLPAEPAGSAPPLKLVSG